MANSALLPQEIGALLGMALGDGHMAVLNGRYYMLKIEHSIKQRPYLEYKADLVGRALDRTVNVRTLTRFKNQNCDKCVTQVQSPLLRPLYELCYPAGKKTVTPEAMEILTMEGFAYWWADDGCLTPGRRKGKISYWTGVLSTYCDLEQALMIANALSTRFGFNLAPDKHLGRYRLRGGTAVMRTLCPLLLPYTPPSMLYKVTMHRN